MGETAILDDWAESTTALWGRQPVCVCYRFADPALFSMESLSAIIERHPRQHDNIVHMDPQGSHRCFRRNGDIAGLSRTIGINVDALASGNLHQHLSSKSGAAVDVSN